MGDAYHILNADPDAPFALGDLCGKVNAAVGNGWRPVGGPFVWEGRLCQAIERETSREVDGEDAVRKIADPRRMDRTMSDIARDLRHLDKSLPAPTLRTSEVMERWLSDITECHQAAADEIDRLHILLGRCEPVIRQWAGMEYQPAQKRNAEKVALAQAVREALGAAPQDGKP